MLGGGESMEPTPDLSVRPLARARAGCATRRKPSVSSSPATLSPSTRRLWNANTSHTTADLREVIDNLPEGTVTLGGMVAGFNTG